MKLLKPIKIDHTEIITRICEADNDEITYKLIPEIIKTPYNFIQREDLLCEIQIRIEENGRLIPKTDLRALLRYKGDPLLEAEYCPGLKESRALLTSTDQYYNKYCISSFHFFRDLFAAHPEIRINTGGKSKIMRKMNFKLWGQISLDGINRTIYTTDKYNRNEVRQLMS